MTTVAEPPRIQRAVPAWHDEAACRLFPELDFVEAKGDTATACRLICSACPVRFACATGSLERGEPWGIWGGLDRTDRKAVAEQFSYPTPAIIPDHGVRSRYVKFGCRCPECKAAHALYESERRAKANRRKVAWPSVHVLASPIRIGRHRLAAGQYLLPLLDLPDDRRAEPADLSTAA